MSESFLRLILRPGLTPAGSLGFLLAGTIAVLCPAASAEKSLVDAQARVARTLSTTDTAHLHLIKASGSMLYEQGHVSGTLPGSMRAYLELGAAFSGRFTISTAAGVIYGRGSAIPHGSGRYESFGGTMVLTGGHGRYAHASGSAHLYGTFDRRTYTFVIQTVGKLTY